MKKLITFILIIFIGCRENVTNNYETDPRFFNDAFHGNIVGKIIQKNSQAKVIVSQVYDIDSSIISSDDGSFMINNLEIGNYDLVIKANNLRTYILNNVVIEGGGTTYLGEIDLLKVPDLVASHYPNDLDEIVYSNRNNRLSISMIFTRPMDRESVEEAFSTDPPSDGIFYWGQYSQAPSYIYYEESRDYFNGGFDIDATITTYSKISSFTYQMAQKDSYVDTTYTVNLATTAKDTADNFLRFPLGFSFTTIQSSSTIDGIQAVPFHGDVEVELLSYDGINITFPRNMEPHSTEAAISIIPANTEQIFLWPAFNQLTIYTGGTFLPETFYEITIGSSAKDLDGVELGNPFTFSFTTSPVKITSTTPRNGQLFVDYDRAITIWFNSYMLRSSVESAFSISPPISGYFKYGTENSDNNKTAITFIPGSSLQKNTKYTINVNTNARDLYNIPMKEPYNFSFITMPE